MHVLFKKVFKIVLHHGMSAWSLISNDNCFLILITNPIGHRGLSCLFITHGLTNIGAWVKTNCERQKWNCLRRGWQQFHFFVLLLADYVLVDNWTWLPTYCNLSVGSGLRRVILVYAEPLKFYFSKLMRYVFCRWLAYSNIRDLIFFTPNMLLLYWVGSW